jgi:hypothetical protein
VKIPEIWAFHSLQGEVIFPGQEAKLNGHISQTLRIIGYKRTQGAIYPGVVHDNKKW